MLAEKNKKIDVPFCVFFFFFNHLNTSQICTMHQDAGVLFVVNDSNKESNHMIILTLIESKKNHEWGGNVPVMFFQHNEFSPLDSEVCVFHK